MIGLSSCAPGFVLVCGLREQVLGAPDWPWHQSFAVAYDYVKQRVLTNPQTGDYVHSVGYAASVNEVFDSLLASRGGRAQDRAAEPLRGRVSPDEMNFGHSLNLTDSFRHLQRLL